MTKLVAVIALTVFQILVVACGANKRRAKPQSPQVNAPEVPKSDIPPLPPALRRSG